MATRLIGIAGKARSGKDTVAGQLVGMYHYTRYSFADPIRTAAKDILMIDEEWIEKGGKELEVPWAKVSYREFAQKMGTEFVREMIHQDFWLLRAEKFISECLNDNIVIPDVRFENEAAFIREQGGTVWHIERSDVESVRCHVSESGVDIRLDLGDGLLMNNGSLQELRAKVRGLL